MTSLAIETGADDRLNPAPIQAFKLSNSVQELSMEGSGAATVWTPDSDVACIAQIFLTADARVWVGGSAVGPGWLLKANVIYTYTFPAGSTLRFTSEAVQTITIMEG